jgi:hypothetical protein
MSDKKEEEQPQQQHIQTEPQDDEQEEKKSSGGLLSTIGDPIGMSSIPLPPLCLTLHSLTTANPLSNTSFLQETS